MSLKWSGKLITELTFLGENNKHIIIITMFVCLYRLISVDLVM